MASTTGRSSSASRSSLDLLSEECVSFLLRRTREVGEMSGIDIKHATAHSVGSGTESLDVLLGVVGDCAAVLLVVSVAVQRNTNDSALDIFWELRDGVEDDGCSLTVVGSLGTNPPV
jgi:hypothetical protein